MYIKRLVISTPKRGILRDINFKIGMNLIIDETPKDNLLSTGNNVGKTTILKLIDFCLGAKKENIYTDEEDAKKNYKKVKDFLINEKVLIELTLCNNFEKNNSNDDDVKIERNFLLYKGAVRKINGIDILEKDFDSCLEKILFPTKTASRPTFREFISHNIRYKQEAINFTLKTMDKFTKDIAYETLYLFLLDCPNKNGEDKELLTKKMNQEESFKTRLEKNQTKIAYEQALSLVNDEIKILNKKKESLNLNEDYERDIENLNYIKFELNNKSSTLSKMQIRKSLIDESVEELKANHFDTDFKMLKSLYEEAAINVSGIQKKFEDLVDYHNKMIVEKIKFIANELPELNLKIMQYGEEIKKLLLIEEELSNKILKSNPFNELEEIIFNLNDNYQKKGEYESMILKIIETETEIEVLSKKLKLIENELFSKEFIEILKGQLAKFNRFFSKVSNELYGEKYALKYNVVNKKGKQHYLFSAFNTNMSSGKKQGEIISFDLACILFSLDENLPCLKFLLNDKKELMHDNQLLSVAKFVQKENLQLIFSILKTKLPPDIFSYANKAIELSQNSKLFRIEEFE